MKVRQSSLASFARCAQQVHLEDVARQRGIRERTLSATAFGTVIHHCAQTLEEKVHEDHPKAIDVAVATFEHYWHPENIGDLVPGGIDEWLPRQTYGGLLIRGRDNLRAYHASLLNDTGVLLALEHSFEVPMRVFVPVTTSAGNAQFLEDHELIGTVDRLALRKDSRNRPYISIDDFKSGQKPTYLRHSIQFTAYSWASTRPEFWDMWPAEEVESLAKPLRRKGLALFQDGSGMPVVPRKGRWIALRDSFGVHDAGWRVEADFQRLHKAVGQYIAARRADIYPLSPSGQVCTYCPFMYSGDCGGFPYDSSEEGQPYPGV